MASESKELFHHILVFLISEEEKASFLKLGIFFSETTRGPRGESASFDIAEADPRWEKVVALIKSLDERDGLPKEYRVQDLTMPVPTWDEAMRQLRERISSNMKSQPGPAWLDAYSGQSADELLALEGKYRVDSLVLAFEEAISQKAEREGMHSLSEEERFVLAVEALEREVNNGGYDQFFVNSSREFAPIVVGALQRIGCKKTATITQKAIKVLGIPDPTAQAINEVMARGDEQRLSKLSRCDDSFYKAAEPIADRLFEFIKANKAGIRL